MNCCAICHDWLELHADGKCHPQAMAKRIGELQAEVDRLKDLCLRAAGYIGVRQGPEVDVEADELMRMLKGEI